MLNERDYNRQDEPPRETPTPEHVARLIARYRAEQAERDKEANRLAFAKYLFDHGLISEGQEE